MGHAHSLVGGTSQLAATAVVILAMVKFHVLHVQRPARIDASTPNAVRSAASHAHPVQKLDVHRDALTLLARCLVQHLAIGCLVH